MEVTYEWESNLSPGFGYFIVFGVQFLGILSFLGRFILEPTEHWGKASGILTKHNISCKILDHSRLEKKLNQTESEYHGLLADISLLLSTSMRSPDLQQKSDDLKEIWQNLKELTQVNR